MTKAEILNATPKELQQWVAELLGWTDVQVAFPRSLPNTLFGKRPGHHGGDGGEEVPNYPEHWQPLGQILAYLVAHKWDVVMHNQPEGWRCDLYEVARRPDGVPQMNYPQKHLHAEDESLLVAVCRVTLLTGVKDGR